MRESDLRSAYGGRVRERVNYVTHAVESEGE